MDGLGRPAGGCRVCRGACGGCGVGLQLHPGGAPAGLRHRLDAVPPDRPPVAAARRGRIRACRRRPQPPHARAGQWRGRAARGIVQSDGRRAAAARGGRQPRRRRPQAGQGHAVGGDRRIAGRDRLLRSGPAHLPVEHAPPSASSATPPRKPSASTRARCRLRSSPKIVRAGQARARAARSCATCTSSGCARTARRSTCAPRRRPCTMPTAPCAASHAPTKTSPIACARKSSSSASRTTTSSPAFPTASRCKRSWDAC